MNKNTVFAALSVATLLLAFQNCGLNSTSHTDMSSLGKTCLATAQKAFADTYYPHVRSQCSQCHDNGGQGISWFASADPSFAFTAFMNTGREKLNSMMVYDGHPGPNNGPGQEGFVASMAGQWNALDKQLDDCMNANAVTTVGKNTSVGDVAITDLANDTNRRPWKTLEFDLFTDSALAANNGKVKMVVRLQYRESGPGVMNGTVREYNSDIGYEFRLPQAKIRDGAEAGTQYSVDKLTILKNGTRFASVTSFQAINNVVVSGNTFIDLIDSAAGVGIVNPKNPATDVFALRFAEIRNANGEPVGGGTGGTIGGGGSLVPARVTYVELSTASNQYGFFASRCIGCHSGANPSGGLNMSTFAGSVASSAAIRSRVNNSSRPMPPAGLLPQFERDVITKWVDIGAPQN